MKMQNVQKGKFTVGFNAAAHSSSRGPSLAEIKTVEVQKTAPAADTEQKVETVHEDEPKDEEERVKVRRRQERRAKRKKAA